MRFPVFASTTLVDTKFSSVSCQPSVLSASACSDGSSSPSKTMPSPGRNRLPNPQATTAATAENPSIQPKVRAARRPVPAPVIDPVATMTDAITSGTMDIWISRMKMSPTNSRLAAQSPRISPAMTPATAPNPMRTAG